MEKRGKITPEERDKISVLLAEKNSLRSIAKELGRSVSSISEEVKRNSSSGVYTAITAQELSEQRNTLSRKTNPLKSKTIYAYVYEKLRSGWSPEQIAGRLKRDNKNRQVICHETIYRYIYSKEGREKNLTEYLVRHHYRRRTWHSRHLYRRGIANRTSIRLRPKEVDSRKTFGHWETDVVEGRAHQGGIQTLLERKTRFFQAKLLERIDSEYGVAAQRDMLVQFPYQARQTVTMDNGKENYNHHKLTRWLGIQTYFCDPYCSWQKGANENHNGVLRRYIPKKATLAGLTQEDLNAIIEEINQRPRKCLGYETPEEVFTRELKLSTMQKYSDSL
ncbi:MAG: IS30 family transposase [Patescibacteria group bacterium]